jgi:hypothetical protein
VREKLSRAGSGGAASDNGDAVDRTAQTNLPGLNMDVSLTLTQVQAAPKWLASSQNAKCGPHDPELGRSYGAIRACTCVSLSVAPLPVLP